MAVLKKITKYFITHPQTFQNSSKYMSFPLVYICSGSGVVKICGPALATFKVKLFIQVRILHITFRSKIIFTEVSQVYLNFYNKNWQINITFTSVILLSLKWSLQMLSFSEIEQGKWIQLFSSILKMFVY